MCDLSCKCFAQQIPECFLYSIIYNMHKIESAICIIVHITIQGAICMINRMTENAIPGLIGRVTAIGN